MEFTDWLKTEEGKKAIKDATNAIKKDGKTVGTKAYNLTSSIILRMREFAETAFNARKKDDKKE